VLRQGGVGGICSGRRVRLPFCRLRRCFLRWLRLEQPCAG